MQYVVVLRFVDESVLGGDDSIENACSIVNEMLDSPETTPIEVRPLSEVLAC